MPTTTNVVSDIDSMMCQRYEIEYNDWRLIRIFSVQLRIIVGIEFLNSQKKEFND